MIDLFMRLYARLICCPCMDQNCVQCQLDIKAMKDSGLFKEAEIICPQISEIEK